jgi:GT2 family glycosyltransferase
MAFHYRSVKRQPLTNSVDQFPTRILAVIVLYKIAASESVTFNTLQKAISVIENGKVDIKILLYDNTPGGQDTGVLPAGVQYKANLENDGLAKAYNYALKIAHENGFDWLLTLDQDTTLPIDFMCKICDAMTLVAPMSTVAAISPSIPANHWIFTKYFTNGFVGISLERFVFAVNSASMLRVSALRTVGGYDEKYWLDFSDVEMYYRLQLYDFHVFVAGDIHVEHEISVFDLVNRASPARYENIHRAEEAFYDKYLGRIEGFVFFLRLIYRLTITLRKAGATLPYYKVGLRFLCRRLFYSRKHRRENWEKSASCRLVSLM